MFPGFTFTSVVAPYWSDVDLRRDGDVYYNVYRDVDSTYIQRATADVRMFSKYHSFTAVWVLVATWVQVPNFPDGSPNYFDHLSTQVRLFFLLILFHEK